jgi:hypothetical protein
MLFWVAGPAVPFTVAKPLCTFGGKMPVMPLMEKRSEKLMTVPPGAAEMILRK